MPRKSTPKKSSAKSGGDKYEYTELAKVSGASCASCNFYGVIVDASFPYKKTVESSSTGKSDQMFICTMKVIDPSQFAKGSGWSQLVIYASKLEDLPFVHRIGDIIRVHRADMKIWNQLPHKKQFNVNMLYKGSWALYSTDKQSPLGQATNDAPYAFSGHRVTQERQDTSILSTLKNWTNMTFKSTDVCAKIDTKTAKLSDADKKQGDFDVVAKIVQIFELDDYTNELKLRDMSGAVYYVLALKVKFPHLKTGAVIKVRSATFDTTCGSDKKVLILQHYSNIMTFVSSSKKASDISAKVSNDNSNESKALKANVAMTPVVLTEVSSKHAALPVTSLHDLFHSAESSTNTFRTCFYVTKVEPGNVADACKVYDKKSKKTSSAKGSKGDMIYQVQFLAKDVSTQFNTNVYRILLYTHEGLGSNFFPQKAANLWSDKGAAKKVEASFAQLTKFNSWVDCVVEKRNGYYFIKDTKMIY